ncbi:MULTISPECIES: hypothetical protein [unclassified Caballeronia]|uniref:hypothetical protein n=1 Tax=unclassified Caballeronia TaxID=2646786 RepID=UPI00202840E7|nr:MULTISPECIES: hypothetical protein [unclassified Caballeronia]
MKTKFEFRSNVGVVAGGDVNSNVGEIHLYVNFDRQGAAEGSIDEEQIQSLTRKIFSVASRSGLDTLRLTEILRAKFGFESINAITASELTLVMAFLGGWEESFAQRTKSYTRPLFGVLNHRASQALPFLRNWYVGCLTVLLLCLLVLCLTIEHSPKERPSDEAPFAVPAVPALTLPGGPTSILPTPSPAAFR